MRRLDRHGLSPARVWPEQTVIVGDRLFAMQIAADAGVRPFGVACGYHPPAELRAAGADVIIESFSGLSDARDQARGAAA